MIRDEARIIVSGFWICVLCSVFQGGADVERPVFEREQSRARGCGVTPCMEAAKRGVPRASLSSTSLHDGDWRPGRGKSEGADMRVVRTWLVSTNWLPRML
jgi:hypothetical protein